MSKLYDINKDFTFNVTFGPFFEDTLPDFPKVQTSNKLFGQKINSLFGVAASPLTHGARNTSLMSKLGYDLITYRSVRSTKWYAGQSYPHWRYVDISHQLTQDELTATVVGADHPFPNQEVSTANSFGIHSLRPDHWQTEFEIAKKGLQKGQLLILSIMFTPEQGKDVVEDAATVANYAKETSAKVFEINLAHPNSGMKSIVFEDIETSVAICKAIKKIITDRPLIAKVGFYRDANLLKKFMEKSAGIIQGISSTNTIALPIVDKDGAEVFPGRPKAGVSGAAIRTLSMQQASKIVEFKESLKLPELTVIGIGGVTKVEHINEYLKLGVDAVQSATGVFADPLLALKFKNSVSEASKMS